MEQKIKFFIFTIIFMLALQLASAVSIDSISATPTSGLAPLTVQFNSAASGNGTLAYLWDFDDGTKSSEQNPTHVFEAAGEYNVKLTVNDANSTANGKVKITVTQSSPLTITADASPKSGTAPLTVSFTASATGNSPFIFKWDFGDGESSSSQNAQHTYNTLGTYFAVLNVTDSLGISKEKRIQITAAGDTTPTVAIASDKTTGNAPLTVRLSAKIESGNAPFTYLWEIGDKKFTTQNVTATFEDPQTYTIKLTVKDIDGDSASSSAKIVVNDESQKEIKIIDFTPKSFAVGENLLKIQVKNPTSDAIKGITAELTGNGFSVNKVVPITELPSGKDDYIFVFVNAANSGEIDTIIKVTGKIETGSQIEQLTTTSLNKITVIGNAQQQSANDSRKTELLNILEKIRVNYSELEKEYLQKKVDGYNVEDAYDLIKGIKSKIQEAQIAIYDGRYPEVQGYLDIINDDMKTLKTILEISKKKDVPLKDRLGSLSLIITLIAMTLGILISSFTLWKTHGVGNVMKKVIPKKTELKKPLKSNPKKKEAKENKKE